ncbi:MAG: hypothetical protein ACTSP4_12935 [Candidatus Hodarchaeales archaeon]
MVTILLTGAVLIAGLVKVKPGASGWEIAPVFRERMSVLFNGRLLVFHGHHPACDLYSSHEISWRGKSFCAGCYGTSFGLLFSLALTSLYYFLAIRGGFISRFDPFSLFSAGFLLLAFSQSRYLLPVLAGKRVDPRFAFFTHASLPLAAITPLLLSLGTGSNLSVIVALITAFSLIGARFLNAGADHVSTCSSCPDSAGCSYRAGSETAVEK